MYGGKSWGRFRHLHPLSMKYSTASTSSRFSHLLLFPAGGNSGAMMAHWLSLKSLAYLRLSFFCIIPSLYHLFIYWYSFLQFFTRLKRTVIKTMTLEAVLIGGGCRMGAKRSAQTAFNACEYSFLRDL